MADGTPTKTGLDKRPERARIGQVEEVAAPFVDREQAMANAIEEGFEDYRNSDVVDHETVKANLAAIVARARKAAA